MGTWACKGNNRRDMRNHGTICPDRSEGLLEGRENGAMPDLITPKRRAHAVNALHK